MQQPTQDQDEYKDAWNEPDADPATVPDEFEQKGADEERSLADQLSEGKGEKLAENKAADLLGVKPTGGLSRQTIKWEQDGGTEPKQAAAPVVKNNPGKDDAITASYKARTANDKRNDGIEKLMKLRNLTRGQAEKLIPK